MAPYRFPHIIPTVSLSPKFNVDNVKSNRQSVSISFAVKLLILNKSSALYLIPSLGFEDKNKK